MHHLWSPWRADHVQSAAARSSDGEAGAVLTRIAQADPSEDADNLVLHRTETALVLLNRYPYTSGHLMVMPVREVSAYDHLTRAERTEIGDLVAEAMGWLRRAMAPDGFNVGINQGAAAGAGLPRHLHVHVVPRWNGDTNFMTSAAETRVLPQSLDATYAALHEARAEMATNQTPPGHTPSRDATPRPSVPSEGTTGEAFGTE